MITRRRFLKNSFRSTLLVSLSQNLFIKANKKLPKVLIIGDSIAGGYFPFVQQMLRGKADVSMPIKADGSSDPCQGTTHGIKQIDQWIGTTEWNVIHFNFGLHDIKHINPENGKNSNNPNDPHQADPKHYKKNLQLIVDRMKTSGANLIFATSTPYPDTAIKPLRLPGMSEKYNKAASKVMKKNKIAVNDLYSFVLPQMEYLQRPNNVHFNETGCQALAKTGSQGDY
jgi:acyl-CoA thioesterase-1